MYLYPCKVHGRLNGRSYVPEAIDLRAMCNPHYRNLRDISDPERPPLLPGTKAIEDSGAYQERDMLERITADAALDRQLAHEQRMRDDGCGTGFAFEAIVTYDMLVGVDEAIVDGKRVKRRGTRESAEMAVCETLASACAYWERRDEVRGAIAYSAQGADVKQYVTCVEALLCLARPGKDWLALGGFCIIGMQPTLKPLFAEVVRRVAPLVRRKGLRRVHILGVFADDALSYAAEVLGREGLEFSTDTSSVELNSIMGKRWDVEDRSERGSPWRKVYSKAEKFKKYHPADLAMENTTRASAWCRSLPGGGDTSAAIPSRPPRPLAPYQTTLW